MKKNDSSNAQDAGHNQARGRYAPTPGSKGKANNSKNMRQEAEEQKAARDKIKRTEEDTRRTDSAAEENY